MATVDDKTPSRAYPKPSGENDLEVDVLRARAALDAIDGDVASLVSQVASNTATAAGAQSTAAAASSAAGSAVTVANDARTKVAVTGADLSPGALAAKIQAEGALVEEVLNPGGAELLKLTVRPATETDTGAARFATDAEVAAGSAAGLMLSPKGLATVLQTGALKVLLSVRTSNAGLTASDKGRFVDFQPPTAGFTQTFAAASSLVAGWFCYLRNSSAFDITLDPNGSETIDGLQSFRMYPGESRLVVCDGSSLVSVVLEGFSKLFAGSDTLVKPPGYSGFDAEGVGGGAGGAGGGTKTNAVEDILAGGGGGGGAYFRRFFAAAELGATEPVGIGAGGLGGAGAASGSGQTSGVDGGNGGDTTLGTKFTARGGLAGRAATTPGEEAGGRGQDAVPGSAIAGGWGSGLGPTPRAGAQGVAAWGGAGGGNPGAYGNASSPGGRSAFGGCGGGGGGGADPTNGSFVARSVNEPVSFAGADGGAPWRAGAQLAGGGGAGGARGASTATNGGEGQAGTTGADALVGTGGGGGGGGGSRGGDGGAGGRGSGGGGGGAGFQSRGGNGGPGGAGALRITGIA